MSLDQRATGIVQHVEPVGQADRRQLKADSKSRQQMGRLPVEGAVRGDLCARCKTCVGRATVNKQQGAPQYSRLRAPVRSCP